MRFADQRHGVGHHRTKSGARGIADQCIDLEASPVEILGWFVHRWSIETTFQESRAHLGVETQGQRSDLAIARTTAAFFGLLSLVSLWGQIQKS
jgi:hypothetical protein